MMKRLSSFCALFLLLITSISVYAGVTDGDVTAYRLQASSIYVMFTDDPLDDPIEAIAPLGAGVMYGTSCTSTSGNRFIFGLLCNGTSGDPIATYTCTVSIVPPSASNTTWCLFSENPRTGDKAWAVKYVNGDIPTNDGDSIVRCQGTDVFHPDNGCDAPLPTQIGIEGGYMKLDTTDGNVPNGGDCAITAHNGRMVVDDVNGTLYICTDLGWKSKLLD